VTWRLALPKRDWGQKLLLQGREWNDLITGLPRTGNRLLEKAERGEALQFGLKDTNLILSQLDRLVTRLALTLLLAALTISLALLMAFTEASTLFQMPVAMGFAMTIGLSLWLFISILRGTR
jgi:hypothetical protein